MRVAFIVLGLGHRHVQGGPRLPFFSFLDLCYLFHGKKGTRTFFAARSRKEPAVGAPSEFSLRDAKRVVLDNGLTLLLMERRRLPIVVARALVRGTELAEPEGKNGLAALTGALLDAGTATLDGDKEVRQAMASKYIDPKRMALVAAGPIDDEGKPLK